MSTAVRSSGVSVSVRRYPVRCHIISKRDSELIANHGVQMNPAHLFNVIGILRLFIVVRCPLKEQLKRKQYTG
jgi:hypothetical protein